MSKKLLIITFALFGAGAVHAQELSPLPDGCGNPFVQSGIFGEFYEKTIRTAVVENGAVRPSDIQLFAVNALRKHVAARFPNPEDGDAIDRHIRAQVCSYAQGKSNLTTSSVELQRHLMAIAPKLLRDTKKLVEKVEAQEKERQKLVTKFETRQGLLERAESLGNKEVSSYLNQNSIIKGSYP